MAILKSSPFGEIRGKIGDFIIKRMKGKTIISQRLNKYPKSKDPAVLARRKRFALSAHFSACMNKSKALRQIWRKSEYTQTKTPYNLMLKSNYVYVSEDDISKDTSLTPNFGNVDIRIKNFSFNEASLSVILNPTDVENDFCSDCKNAEYVQMVGVLMNSKSYDLCKNPFRFDLLESNKVKIVNGEEINLYYYFDDLKKQYMREYSSQRLFILFIVLDIDLMPVGYSNTYDVDVDSIPFNRNMSEEQ